MGLLFTHKKCEENYHLYFMTMSSYSARWDQYNTNMKDYLQQEKTFANVTLACDDEKQIKAHKLILSAGSLFFRNILTNTKHLEPFIFLSGVVMSDLENIVKFIYTGETNIEEDRLEMFLKTANLLQVIGLDKNIFKDVVDNLSINNEEIGIDEIKIEPNGLRDEPEYHITVEDKFIKEQIESETFSEELMENGGGELHDNKEEVGLVTEVFVATDNDKGENRPLNPYNIQSKEQDNKLIQLVKKMDGFWICTICGNTKVDKIWIKRHAESHLGPHSCTICGKSLKTRTALKVHWRYAHVEQQCVCVKCGKSLMNRSQLTIHDRNSHGARTLHYKRNQIQSSN